MTRRLRGAMGSTVILLISGYLTPRTRDRLAHLDSIVIAGAQAVYLRTGDIDVGVAAYTTDGDLEIDPRNLADAIAC